MRLEEALPALRQGAEIRRSSDLTRHIVLGEADVIAYDPQNAESMGLIALMTADVEADDWEVVLPARAEGHADADSREPSTADRPVPGYGGFVLNIKNQSIISLHDADTNKMRFFLDTVTSPEVAQIDGRWLYVDPSLPKVNG